LAACFNNENAGRMPALPGFAKNLRCARPTGAFGSSLHFETELLQLRG